MIKYAPLPGSENMYPGVHGAKATCQRLTLGLFNRIYILQLMKQVGNRNFRLMGYYVRTDDVNTAALKKHIRE